MEQQLKKLQICAYIIIALLIFNTIALLAAMKDPVDKTNNNADTEQNFEYDVSMFETVDANKFEEIFNGDELRVVYIGRPTCGYCVEFLPVLQQAQDTYGYTTVYIDIDTMDADGQTKIMGLDSYLSETYGQTPNVVLVKDGKVVANSLGFVDYNTLAAMLEANGFEK